MENKIVGFIVLVAGGIIGLVTFLFNRALTSIVNTSCSHGVACPMWQTIGMQTNISLILMGFILLVGLYLIFSEQIDSFIFRLKPQVETKQITRQGYRKVLSSFKGEEKQVFEKIIDAQGVIFQSKLVELTGFGKVKVTRILDGLEAKDFVERKRRGMSNLVVLKQ